MRLTGPDRRSPLEELRDQALRDLADLDDQVTAGEIGAHRADELRRHYEADAAHALEQLTDLDTDDGREPVMQAAADAGTRADEPSPQARPGRTSRRRVAATMLTVTAGAAIVLAVGRDVAPRPAGGFVTGNQAQEGRDLAQVTNEEMEQVVAANPDVIAMRLRLAHRYLDDDDRARAIDHYLAVLDREPDPEAMSHLGWLLFLDGRPALAAELLTASLQRVPDDPETIWFLANVRLYGQQEPDDAIALLERLLDRDDLAAARSEIDAAIADARAAQDGDPAVESTEDDDDG